MRKQSLSCLKGNMSGRKFPWGLGGEGRRGRSLERFTQKKLVYVLQVEYIFFPRSVCVFKDIFLRHILQQYLLWGTWRIDGKWKNSIWALPNGTTQNISSMKSCPPTNSIYNIRFLKLSPSNLYYYSLIIWINIT